jgi:LmbE family N-acetylglucosaminyl deacetylase
MTKKHILVVAAHPDDEVLGCGGTIALHTRVGDSVTVVLACEGESLRYGSTSVGQIDHMHQAAEKLGVKDTRLLAFKDQQLDTVTLTKVISPLEKIVQEIKPEVVYCQYGGDINLDHQLLFKAVLVATRPTNKSISAVYCFDTASSTEWAYPRTFVPDTWVDITTTLNAKLSAMSCYVSELREYPHPRSLKALEHKARSWGNQSCIDAAEVFMTVRKIFRHDQTPS